MRPSPPDPLSSDRVSQALTQLGDQRRDDQRRLAGLNGELQDVTAALAQNPAADTARALNGQLSEIRQEVARLDLEERERGEQVQLLTALEEARARHEDASQRLAEAKRQAEQGGSDDYGSLAAYELMTRHDVADLRDIVVAWERGHPPDLLDSRLWLAQSQGGADRIRAAAAAIDDLRDPAVPPSQERIQAALDAVRLAREAGEVAGLLPGSLTLGYRNPDHNWQAELSGLETRLAEAADGTRPLDPAVLDSAADYLAAGAGHAGQSVARSQHDLRLRTEMVAHGSTVDPLTGSILAVPALGEPAEAEPPPFSMVPAILSTLLDPRGMLGLDGVPLEDRLAASLSSADQALLRNLLDGAGAEVREGDFGFQLAAMVKRVPYNDTHLESMPQAGLHDAQTQQVSFWPRWYDIRLPDGTHALLIVADNIREERSFTHEVYPHSIRAGIEAPGGVLGLSGMFRVQYSDKTTFEMNHEGARAVVGWVHEPGGGWRQVSGYLPGESVHQEVKRSAGWDIAYGGDVTAGPLDVGLGGKLKYKRVVSEDGTESYTRTNLFGVAYNQDFGLIQPAPHPGLEAPLPDGGRVYISYNPQKDGKVAVEVWPVRARDADGVPTVTPKPVNLETPVIGGIRRWLLEHGAPREILPPEPPVLPDATRPGLPRGTSVPGSRLPGEPPLLTPGQQAAFDAQYQRAVQSGDPAQIEKWNEELAKALNDAADARIAAATQHARDASEAAEAAMRRLRTTESGDVT